MLTHSPINKTRLTGQNKRLLDYLLTGKSIHCLDPVRYQLQIGYLNSRIADLKNHHQINISSHFISVTDCNGKPVSVKLYKLGL